MRAVFHLRVVLATQVTFALALGRVELREVTLGTSASRAKDVNRSDIPLVVVQAARVLVNDIRGDSVKECTVVRYDK